jgi:hypothetical protein
MNLYHYCSNASFVSIISTKEIWASDFSLSNDLLEGKWVRQVFLDFCHDKNVAAADQLQLLEHFDEITAIFGGTGFCMSEEGDLLSQWRAYANDGVGVSIGFNKEYLEALGKFKQNRNDTFNASLTKVEYSVARQKEYLSENAEKILKFVSEGVIRRPTLLTPEPEADRAQREVKLGEMLLQFVFFFGHLYSFKNPAFAEEREWRLISHVIRQYKQQKPSNDLKEMEFRPLVDRLVPFRRIPLEQVGKAPVTEIVLGPKNVTPEEIIHALLEKNGFSDVTVKRSKASYR